MRTFLRPAILCLLSGFALAFAQSTVKIEGVVRDAANNTPVAGAMVLIIGTTQGATTDFSGRFTLKDLFVGEYSLQARHLGYKLQTIALVEVGFDQATVVNFRLEPQPLEIPGVIISAERFASPTGLSSVQISRQQIERSQAANLGELLANSCGLDVTETGSGTSISIRGSQSNQVVVLLDGMRLDNPLTGAVDLSILPLAAIDRIEVHKGAQSLSCGSGAIGGIVDIRTRQAAENQWSVEGRAAAFAGAGGTLSWSQAGANLGWYLSIDHRRNRGDYSYSYERAGQIIEDKRRNADASQSQFFLRFSGALAGARWNLAAQSLRSERGLPGQIHAWTPEARATAARDHFTASCADAGPSSGWEASMAYSVEMNEYRHQPDAELPLRDRTVPAYWNENMMRSTRISLERWQRAWSGSRWILGGEAELGQFSDCDFLTVRSAVGEVFTRSAAGFFRLEAEQSLPLGLHASLVSGLRHDYARIRHPAQQRQEGVWSPALNMALAGHALIDARIHVSWSRGFRLPTFADLFYQQYRVQGNAALLPERSRSREYGMNLSSPNHGHLNITRFRDSIEDLIIWQMGSFATFSPVNSDALLAGTEYEAVWQIAPGQAELQLSHLALESKNLQPGHTVYGKSLPYRPDHTTKLSLRVTPGALFFEYSARQIGPRYVTEANTIRMPGYQAHDLSFGGRFAIHGLVQIIKLAIYNLTDKRYQAIENAPLPGREWRVSWQVGNNAL